MDHFVERRAHPRPRIYFEGTSGQESAMALHRELLALKVLNDARKVADQAYWDAVYGKASPSLVLFHGTPRFAGVLRERLGLNYTDDPGLHLSNRIDTALRCAGTGEQATVLRVELSPTLTWAHQKLIAYHAAVDALVSSGLQGEPLDQLMQEARRLSIETARERGSGAFEDNVPAHAFIAYARRLGVVQGMAGAVFIERLAAFGAQAMIKRVSPPEAVELADPLDLSTLQAARVDLDRVEDWVSVYDLGSRVDPLSEKVESIVRHVEAMPAERVRDRLEPAFQDTPPVAEQLRAYVESIDQAMAHYRECANAFERDQVHLQRKVRACGAAVAVEFRDMFNF